MKPNVDDCRQFQNILQVKRNEIITKPVPGKTKRSFSGCVSCKKRKIKCDENKPCCNNCTKRNLECIWRDYRNKRRSSKVISHVISPPPDDSLQLEKFSRSVPENELTSWSDNYWKVCTPLNSNPIHTLFPDISLSNEDSFYFYYFIEQFVPTIARPHICDQVTPQSVLIPIAYKHKALLDIFLACGASSLAFRGILTEKVAHLRYLQALTIVSNEIKMGNVNGNEEWFFAAVQILQIFSLRNKTFSSNATVCARHFNAAYEILKRKLSDYPSIEPSDDSVQQDSFKLPVIRPYRIVLSPLEKVLARNFLFNYSITIFFCDHDSLKSLIPNPFLFFDRYSSFCIIQLENGDSWITRNIEEPAAYAFEIAAKCSWLCRLLLPFDKEDMEIHKNLLSFTKRILTRLEGIKPLKQLNSESMNSIAIAKLVLRTCKILLMKMLAPDILTAKDFQEDIKMIVKDISSSHIEVIFPIWSLMIAACTLMDFSDRMCFLNRLKQLLYRSNSQIVLQVVSFLEGMWDLHDDEKVFELIFDSNVLDLICT